jgi:hypothetical protein
MSDDQQLDKSAAAVAARFSRDMEIENKFRTRAENQIGVPDYATIASDAYQAYGRVTNFKNYQGLEMPGWMELPDQIRLAWTAAVKQAVEEFVGCIFGDAGCFARAYARGEPTFTLIARDPTSPAVIVNWMGRNLKAPEHKIDEAFAIAKAMDLWPDKKAAD